MYVILDGVYECYLQRYLNWAAKGHSTLFPVISRLWHPSQEKCDEVGGEQS